MTAMLTAPPPDERRAPLHRTTVLRLGPEGAELCDDHVVEEVPVALTYNGIVHAVMLATPEHLDEFALGFSLSEGIVASADELYDVTVADGCDGMEVRMDIPLDRFMTLKKGSRRSLTGRSGCGLCGLDSLQAVTRVTGSVAEGTTLPVSAVAKALGHFGNLQRLHRITGAVHAVAWVDATGDILALREDVGRHNALDKLIGWLVASGTDRGTGFVLTSSRASYELVQKSAAVGIGALVAISAPTGMAVRMAESTGLTLAGFARGNRLVVYSHEKRWRQNI
ncbi:formate dehydrogenase accessory protein FdhD [Azospirillum agricola]|uniref:formate dehydrogenase accessory sulfurtransferase FdhD n=1 Tax=Azospirillum agricola TaxID=1720247 RepID=UPI001F342DBE|nr:formate dehydrogenase accessory sulfurtransferase FdhD [Azospirillum agricola]MBP2231215.1 formate dehydrogenase accessory protein FdhD [Azospirillum agricola]